MCNLLPFILFLFLSCKGDNNDSLQIAQGNDAIEDPDDCSNCLWKEEFEGPEINLNNWNFQLGYGDWEGANGWGNDEWQEYTDQNNVIIIREKEDSVIPCMLGATAAIFCCNIL